MASSRSQCTTASSDPRSDQSAEDCHTLMTDHLIAVDKEAEKREHPRSGWTLNQMWREMMGKFGKRINMCLYFFARSHFDLSHRVAPVDCVHRRSSWLYRADLCSGRLAASIWLIAPL